MALEHLTVVVNDVHLARAKFLLSILLVSKQEQLTQSIMLPWKHFPFALVSLCLMPTGSFLPLCLADPSSLTGP